MALNHIVLVGRVERSPEKRLTPDGLASTRFRIKVARPPRQEGEEPRFDYIPVVASRRLADLAAELRADELVAVEGRLVTQSWEEHGQRRKRVDVDASSLQRIGNESEAVLTPAGEDRQPESVNAGTGEDEPIDTVDTFDDSIPF